MLAPELGEPRAATTASVNTASTIATCLTTFM